MTAQSAVPVMNLSTGKPALSGQPLRALKDKATGKTNFSSCLQKVQTNSNKQAADPESSVLLAAGNESQNYLSLPSPLAAKWLKGEVPKGEEAEIPKAAAILPLEEAGAVQSSNYLAFEAAVSPPEPADETSGIKGVIKNSDAGASPPAVPVTQNVGAAGPLTQNEEAAPILPAENITSQAAKGSQPNPDSVNPTENLAAEKPGNEKIPTEKNQDMTLDVKKALEFESNKINGAKMSSGSDQDAQENTGSSNTHDLTNAGQTMETRVSSREGSVQEIVRPPVNAREILDQMAEKIQLTQNKETSEIKVDLKPDSLGKMSIKIAMEGGVLTAKIITDNYQVKNLLENNIHLLKQTLDNQGIKVERTDVNVQLNNEGMFNQSGGNSQESWQERTGFVQTYGTHDLLEDDSTLEEYELYASSRIETEDQGMYEEYSMNFVV